MATGKRGRKSPKRKQKELQVKASAVPVRIFNKNKFAPGAHNSKKKCIFAKILQGLPLSQKGYNTMKITAETDTRCFGVRDYKSMFV